MRDAAGELDHFEPALDVALGVGEGLAVLGGEQPRQIVILALDQLQKFEHDAGAALRIGRGPARKRGLGIGDRFFDLGFCRQRDLGLHLAGIGIKDVAEAPGRALDLFAADKMANLAHVCSPWARGAASASTSAYLAAFFHGGHPLVWPPLARAEAPPNDIPPAYRAA